MKQWIVNMLLAILVFSGFVSAKNKEQVLLRIDGKPILKEEFVRIYEKNNKNLFDPSGKLTPKEYLNLFINFKLKVLEAESLGLDTVSSFIDELAGYRNDLAATYLTDVSYNEKMVEEMYRRMNLEIRASHILIKLGQDAYGVDKLKAYNKISDIREKILNEEADFNEMAAQYSEDPSAKNNKGQLGYFSAFQMVYPFENAAYTTPVGKISEPIRSRFGYHLVKVDDARDAKGEIKVAHIMKAFPRKADANQRAQTKLLADSIYQLLQNGHNFEELARKESDDQRSAQIGGELPWFSSANMISNFSTASFSLENNGDYSKPVVTSYGYHIIKRIDYKPIPPFNEIKGDIEEKIMRDPERVNKNKEAFINKLKKEYFFKEKQGNLEKLPEGNNKEDIGLFELDSILYTSSQFTSFLKEKHPGINLPDKAEIAKHYEEWVDAEITNYEDGKLEEKYPDFRYLVKEYHDGILLFNLSEKKIWKYAANDTLGLEAFYNDHADKYLWGERFKGLIIKCKDLDIRDKADQYFEEHVPYQEILDILNDEQKGVLTIEEGTWEQHANPIVDYYVWKGEKPKGLDEQLVYIRGDMVGPQPKTLDEARGLYISDYQNFLEKKWIEELREKYKVKVYKKVLKSIKGV